VEFKVTNFQSPVGICLIKSSDFNILIGLVSPNFKKTCGKVLMGS
jgi:hypothetical protein